MTRNFKSPITVAVPSRGALAGNPSDIAASQGVGAVFAVPLWNYIASVSLLPTTGNYTVVGSEGGFLSLEEAIRETGKQGVGDGNNLFQASNIVFGQMLEKIGMKPTSEPFAVFWSTTIPRQRGMSGSSAIITAYLKALLKLHGLDRHNMFSPSRLANWILKVETEQLGVTAGLQDRVLQAYSDEADAVYMDFSREAFAANKGEFGQYEPIRSKTFPKLALLLSDEPSHSGQAHKRIKALIEEGDKKIVSQMQKIALLAKEAALAFREENWLGLGNIMAQNADKRVEIYGKTSLGKNNLAMLDLCRRSGCFGNFTGSGGAVVALLPSEDSFDRLVTEAGESFRVERIN